MNRNPMRTVTLVILVKFDNPAFVSRFFFLMVGYYCITKGSFGLLTHKYVLYVA